MKKILITGAAGLIGRQCAEYFSSLDYLVIGIDNNQRGVWFGKEGSVEDNINFLKNSLNEKYIHYGLDLRNRAELKKIFSNHKFDAIIASHGQCSHDFAAKVPFEDFDINAGATLSLLEYTKQFCPNAKFMYMSTNKVYGDACNKIEYIQDENRFYPKDIKYKNGFDETLNIDDCMHSLFGVSKLYGDQITVEYGKYFHMNTCVLRCGCMTGKHHASTQLHGFINYIIKSAIHNKPYKIFGNFGKTVRDNIDAFDVATAINEYINKPSGCGMIYNFGGGIENNISINEIIIKLKNLDFPLSYEYDPITRKGDHIWWISDLKKFRSHYPNWNITKSINTIIQEIIEKELESNKK